MARHRTHSIEFKRQVAQDYLAGETLHSLARRHDLSRNLIRIWIQKFEAGAFDDEAAAADLIEAYGSRAGPMTTSRPSASTTRRSSRRWRRSPIVSRPMATAGCRQRCGIAAWSSIIRRSDA